MKKISLIYGGGVIGSFLACCLISSNHTVFFLVRGKNYEQIKRKGLKVDVFKNIILKKKYFFKESKKFKVIKNLRNINKIKFHNIFITTTINESLVLTFKNIERFVHNKKTLIITPCTAIPFWWYNCLKNKKKEIFKKKLPNIFKKNLKRKNLVGMTMWLSGKKIMPGKIKISHIQRGFPIKEVFIEKKKLVNNLRKDIQKNCISPRIKNVYSEIFIKAINSLAFNLVALKYNQNNFKLSNNLKARTDIKKILDEGDLILKKNNIPIPQSSISRIKQTLSSTKHTMSMLNSVKNNKKTELKNLWLSFEEMFLKQGYKMLFSKNIYKFVKSKYEKYI